MTTGMSSGRESRKRRRRSTTLPGVLAALDYAVLIPLILLAAGVVWILGGNRLWIMMPMILLSFAAGLLFVVRFFISRYRHDLVLPAGGFVALLFSLYLATSAPWAEIPHEAWQEFYRFAGYALAYWMWVNLLRFNRRWRWVLMIVMLSVSVMAWYAMIQEAQGTRMAVLAERHSDYGMRASGAYICPNHFAHLLQMVMLISLGVLFARGAGVPMKLFAGYTIVIGLYPLFLSLSRAGWIGFMTGLVVFAIAMASRAGLKKFLLTALVAPLLVLSLAVTVWAVSPSAKARVDQALQGDVRIPLWKDSLAIARDAPWFGHGLGSYRHMYPAYHHHMVANRDPEFAHNDYLHFWCEIGLLGLTLAGLVFALIVLRAIRVLWRNKRDGDCALMSGLLAMMAGTAAHTFFDFNLNIFGNVHVLIFLVAAMMAATRDEKIDATITLQHRVVPWAGAGLLLLLVSLIVGYGRMTVSYFKQAKGETAAHGEQWQEASEAYRQAIAWAPGNWRAHLGLASVNRMQAFWMRNPERRESMIEAGMRHYQIASEQNPWSPVVRYGFGIMERIRGDQDAALARLREAQAKAPRQVFYLNEVGHQLRNMRRYEEALDVFTASLAMEPTPVARSNITILNRWIAAPAARDQSGVPAAEATP